MIVKGQGLTRMNEIRGKYLNLVLHQSSILQWTAKHQWVNSLESHDSSSKQAVQWSTEQQDHSNQDGERSKAEVIALQAIVTHLKQEKQEQANVLKEWDEALTIQTNKSSELTTLAKEGENELNDQIEAFKAKVFHLKQKKQGLSWYDDNLKELDNELKNS